MTTRWPTSLSATPLPAPRSGVDPLPMEDLAALAEAMLTGNVSASQTLH